MKAPGSNPRGAAVFAQELSKQHGMQWRIFSGSIRRMLITLVLAAVLPALGIILYTGLEAREHALRDSENSAVLLALSMAEVQERTTQSIQQLLLILSKTALVQQAQEPLTSEFFEGIVSSNPLLMNILLADLRGDILAAALPHKNLNITDRDFFQKTIRENAFTPGEYLISKAVGVPVFPFAFPLRDPAGNVKGVLIASIKLDGYVKLFQNADFPKDSIFSLVDSKGIRLCRFPFEDKSAAGTPLPESVWAAMTQPDGQGFTIQQGSDGVRRMFAFAKLRLEPEAPPYMYLIVGIPEKHGLEGANALLKRNLALLAAASLLALGIAWVLGKLLLANRIERLVEVTERVGQGDLAARIGPTSTTNELGRLEKSVDTMAEALAWDAQAKRRSEDALRKAYDEMEQRVAARTRELRDANERLKEEVMERVLIQRALRQSEEIHRSLYEQAPVGILLVDRYGKVLDANPAALCMLGHSLADIRQTAYTALIHPDSLKANPVDLKNVTEGRVIRMERTFLTREGKQLPVDVSGGRVKSGMIQVIFRDATERKKLEQLRADIERITHHDLKTPLLGIAQVPALLLKSDNLTSRQRDFLQLLHDSGNRMLRTLNMSLSLYRMESGTYECEPAAFNMLQSVRQVCDGTKPLSDQKGVTITVLLDGFVPDASAEFIVEGEEHLCFSMLDNLFKNAIEASPESGEVVITLDSLKRTLTIWNKGEVPANIRDKFFEKYATAGKKWGTGLGTYSAWLIAKTCNWEIRVDVTAPGETSLVIHFQAA